MSNDCLSSADCFDVFYRARKPRDFELQFSYQAKYIDVLCLVLQVSRCQNVKHATSRRIHTVIINSIINIVTRIIYYLWLHTKLQKHKALHMKSFRKHVFDTLIFYLVTKMFYLPIRTILLDITRYCQNDQ